MSLTERERINTIAPALRVLGAEKGVCKLVSFDAAAADDAVAVDISADTPEAVVAELKAALAGRIPAAVTVAGLGTFRLTAPQGEGRVAGKVAVVTGAAQGFGLQIAQDMAAQGATVVLADLNVDGARQAAAELCAAHGGGRAMAVAVDVTDVESVQAAFDEVVRTYGGLDVLISNAGVLKAESVKTQPVKDFDFVAAVNYKGYFLCVQAASVIMAAGHMVDPAYRSDIVQINSKSGLVGSNRNGAYAGSKFGGVGLTQSFALELVADGVKVNSICPGNFFDGPLWSEPENGLFAQYLRTGKVPGARTIADVRAAYEAKVPMGRGCTTADVMNAVYYLIDQQYETGQAVPVTGGQVMLS